ncbi:TlpA family protein disulfide reductase [Caenimonas sedimenti]|uniref:TlpA family protein disulfide reductase n=1 Tax=Caenimonas sedimenti TaxID=2596921 RepID=A0A562ZK93_9BURK|nr:TlpA disulfide reductase family protein [Caenimonas sedimenti]TWO68841.1 TlpA family protein disulfide reductase [Caenimonas sedimenti]
MTGAVAAGAVAAGAGVAWWRLQPGAADDAAVQALWALSFQTPQGTALPLAAMRGRPLLMNFWATWCPPCVEEMPLLDGFFRQHSPKGWQVVGLAIDQPSAVRTFLARRPVTFPIGMAGLEGTELTKQLGNLTGGLPFTVVFGPDGAVRQRRMGRVSEADLAAWAQAS